MSRVLTDSFTHAYTECEKLNCYYVPSTTIFQNKSFLFYKSKPLDGSQYQVEFPKLCVFMHLWAIYFWVYTVGRRAPFQHFYGLSLPMIMSNRECRVFHPGEGSTPTCYAQHTFFIFKNRETHFGCCPILPSPPSNTKHSVDCYLELTPMS